MLSFFRLSSNQLYFKWKLSTTEPQVADVAFDYNYKEGGPSSNNIFSDSDAMIIDPVESLINARNESDEKFSTSARSEPRVVWVGGQGRSGTTLVRAMLDAYLALNCGPETSILAELLSRYSTISDENSVLFS